MRANTLYHMRARVQFEDGTVRYDADRTFTTGSFGTKLPDIETTVSPGATPANGIELVDATAGAPKGYLQAYATDLQGNVIWGYDYPDRDQNAILYVLKPLPNGHFLAMISGFSTAGITPNQSSNTNVLREIDLAGNTIRETTLDQLNQQLHSAGYDFTLSTFHHDVAVLPNGHWVALANIVKSFTDLPGYPGTTNVLGDVIVDLDQDLKPVWVWNEFDHLDINRHPMSFPDWTHTNAVIYSKDDGNLLVSLRHQNWIVKIDYRDGLGSGDILWRLGNGGDFTLQGGTAPQDWQYAQHGPAFQSDNTAGNFLLSVMDNGDDRVFSSDVTCDQPGQPPCLYTSVPIYQIDESARTATLVFHQVLPTPEYSNWGGNTERLENGNVYFDLASASGAGVIEELTNQPHPELVWQMLIRNENSYRAVHLPSLYPGIQW
jgi:hypothetical protein